MHRVLRKRASQGESKVFFWREEGEMGVAAAGWNSSGVRRWRSGRGVVKSVTHDDGEKRAEKARRADGYRGVEVRERVRAAGAGAGRASLPARRHRERYRALDGPAARRSAQSLPDLAAAAIERGNVFLLGVVSLRGNRPGAGKALGGIFDDCNDGVVNASGDIRNLRASDVAESCGVAGEYCGGGVLDSGAAEDKGAGAPIGIRDGSEQIAGSE